MKKLLSVVAAMAILSTAAFAQTPQHSSKAKQDTTHTQKKHVVTSSKKSSATTKTNSKKASTAKKSSADSTKTKH